MAPIETLARPTGVLPRRIQRLSAAVVNKIAAGEVIERPASVVKELLENSIDAGATRIEVAIENGGLDAIRITDNGCGIPAEDLELAVTSHATSKIQFAEDLFQVGTFGFRGEALASIAEVSEFLIRSRTADQESGYEQIIRGGVAEAVQPVGCPVGTTIRVDQLFFNTPVRRKFLRTAPTEAGHVAEAFTRIALAHPDCHLTLISGGKLSYDLPPCGDWQTRIHDFFGSEISDVLIPIESSEGGVTLRGFVVDPAVSRSHNRMQYLFLNGRFIRDRSLQHALSEAYRGLLMTGRFPVCFLRLGMPFEQVDVNVHPAKLEVRFQDGGRLYSQLLSTLRNRFLATDLTARAQLTQRGQVPPPIPSPFGSWPQKSNPDGGPLELQAPRAEQQQRLEFPTAPARNWVDAPWQPPGAGPPSVSIHIPPSGDTLQPPAPTPSPSLAAEMSGRSPDATLSVSTRRTAASTGNSISPIEPPNHFRSSALQVHNTYLITETEEGMVVIDQHALHERILYEQLKQKVLAGQMETQQLLVPEPVTLRPAEAAAVLEKAEMLRRIGIAVEPFGGDTVAVTAYPAMLANHSPSDMLRSLVDPLMTEGAQPEAHSVLDELLHRIACKAAIKAGDRLSREEITSLLEHRGLCQDAHHCPHGRPTALVFSREELDRRFKRI